MFNLVNCDVNMAYLENCRALVEVHTVLSAISPVLYYLLIGVHHLFEFKSFSCQSLSGSAGFQSSNPARMSHALKAREVVHDQCCNIYIVCQLI